MSFHDGLYIGSRSAHGDLKDCARMRFLGQDLDGLGYSYRANRVPLLSGTHEHNVLADILGHYGGLVTLPGADPVETALEKVRAAYTEEILAVGITDLKDEDVVFTMQEQLTMLEGMTRGWVIYRLPHILDEYDVVEIEQEWLFTLGPGVHWPLRMDAILRRKLDGFLHVMDYKGIPYGDDAWQAKHENSDQTIIYLEGLEERTGETVGGMIYEGLVRGAWRKDTAKSSPFFGRKIQQSAYTYGYKLDDGYNVQRQSAYTNRKGWVKFRVADELPVTEWLDLLVEEGTLPELFIKMEPVSPPPAFRAERRREIVAKEQRYIDDLRKFNELREKLGADHPDVQAHLTLFADRNTDRCHKYGEGYRCPFTDNICLQAGGGLDLLPEDPAFKQREPHHDVTNIIPLRRVA